MDMYFALFNMDTGCVDAWLTDGTIVSINCTAVERVEADNLYQRAELDYLIYNDPKAYAELVWDECPELFLKTATDYTRLCDLR